MGEIEELQKQIADLDREINRILAEKRLPPLKPPRPFPLSSWVLAIVLVAYYLFGDLLPYVGTYHGKFGLYAFYAGLVMALLALLLTVRWLFSRAPRTPPEYIEASRKAQELQNQRRLLEKQLREARKREAEA